LWLAEWFTVSIPEKEGEEPKRWGRQGEITDAELEKVKVYILRNRIMLLKIWYNDARASDVVLHKYGELPSPELVALLDNLRVTVVQGVPQAA
jgi:hypothetical protein